MMETPLSRLRILAFTLFFSLFGMFLSNKAAFAQGGLRFMENKGQWNPEVLYRAELPNGYIYLRQGGITYSFLSAEDMHALRDKVHGTYEEGDTAHLPYDIGPRHKPDHSQTGPSASMSQPEKGENPLIIHGHAYQVNFIDANKNPQIVANHQSAGRYNYLMGKDRSKWGQNVRAFGGVTYKNLYPGTDMHIYSDRGGLKYDMVVSPGGNPEDIKFNYNGAEKLFIKKNQLYIETSIGTNIELAPYAYQVVENKRIEIKCKYRLKGNTLSFKTGSAYNPDYPLVIDPNFIFASYSGSSADNWGYTATYDAEGNFYMGGIVFGSGYPTTPGA